jgi:5-methylcytosine-specific restriction endonuclease McrA
VKVLIVDDDIIGPPLPEIISREDAIAKGLKRYFTGDPCKHGHVTERRCRDHRCMVCYAIEKRSPESKALNVKHHLTRKAKNPGRGRGQKPRDRKAYMAAYNAANADRNAAYRKANTGQKKAYMAAYRKANADRNAAYRKANADRNAAYRKSRPPRINLVHARNHRSRKQAAEGRHTAADIQRIYDAQGGRCACCREKVGKKYHVDHIVPLKLGGSNWPSNLQIACASCNCRKKDRDPIEHMQSLGLLL